MKFNRWICALLLLCMVLTVLPVQAVHALEVPKNTISSERIELPFRVNPRYEGLIDPAQIEIPSVDWTGDPVPAANIKFLSMDEAAAAIRENMKNRVTIMDINLAASGYSSEVVEELIEKAVAHTGKPDEGDSLAWQFAGYAAGVKVQDGGVTYRIEMVYYTTAQQEAEMDRAVANLLYRLNLKNKSDYEKVRGVYDYVCKNVTYDHKNLNDNSYTLKFTPYAALINKTAVCQGYALLMYRLLLELGVDNRLIAGIGGGEAHGWNIVKLDGFYYNLDSTWDAGVDKYAFFLKSRENFPGHMRYLDYDYISFHKKYPMSDRNYAAGQKAKRDPYIDVVPLTAGIEWALTWDGVLEIKGSGNMPDYSKTNPYYIPRGETAPWMYWKDEIVKVTVGKDIKRIGEMNFAEMKNLKSAVLAKGVERIGFNAFKDCAALTSVELNEGLKFINSGAFANCTKLKNIKLPGSLELLENAFHNCVSLEEITIPEKLTTFVGFKDCKNLKTVYIKSSGAIGGSAFEGCTSLSKVVISDRITTIYGGAFEKCSSLTEITIPASVTRIDHDVFKDCTGLKTVYFPGNAPSLGANMFKNVTATVYFAADDENWFVKSMKNYGGNITWVPKCFNSHPYDEGVVTTPPGCTTEGVMTYTCTNCGVTRTGSIPPVGHTSGSAQVQTEPTCMTLGVMEHVCAVCNETYVTDIPRLPHTCENGICTACGNSVFRLAGANRWETAVKVADQMRANLAVEKFDAIIIASGNDFADALAGSYLSTVKNAPILLAWGKGGKYEYLDTNNIDYIKANLAEGGTVYILGGTNAVPELYETSLAGFTVKRLGGANRFETNLLILAEAGVAEGSEILVCTSTNFADSLSASATGKPILLVFNESGKLYGAQPEFLAGLTGCKFTVIGGENAVGAALAEAIGAYGEVTRLAGANRFETSVLVARKYFEDPEYAVLAYAWNYPDGLCGGALAYTLKAPLILTMTNYEAQAAEYIGAGAITKGDVLGGAGLISDDAIRTIFGLSADTPIAVKDRIAQPVVDDEDDPTGDGTTGDGTTDDGTTGDGTTDDGTTGDGTTGDGTTDDGTTGDGTTDDGTTDDGTTDDGTTGDGTTDDGTTGDGTTDDGTTDDGTTDDGTTDDGTTGDGTTDDGTTGDGTTDDGTTDDGTTGDGSTDNTPEQEYAITYRFYDYENQAAVDSVIAAYQAVTGIPCYRSSDNREFENAAEGYDENCRVFMYDYDRDSWDAYISYLESQGFVLYGTKSSDAGTSHYYHHPETGFFVDLFLTNEMEFLMVEPFTGIIPQL